MVIRTTRHAEDRASEYGLTLDTVDAVKASESYYTLATGNSYNNTQVLYFYDEVQGMEFGLVLARTKGTTGDNFTVLTVYSGDIVARDLDTHGAQLRAFTLNTLRSL